MRDFYADFERSGIRKILRLELVVRERDDDGFIPGCGMLVINPPGHFDRDAKRIVEISARRSCQRAGSAKSTAGTGIRGLRKPSSQSYDRRRDRPPRCKRLRPEHTLAAYYIAVQQGADFIEPDLVITERWRAYRPARERNRRTTNVFSDWSSLAADDQTIDGAAITGWFTEDSRSQSLRPCGQPSVSAERPAMGVSRGCSKCQPWKRWLALVKVSTSSAVSLPTQRTSRR